jgi:hypothetical protein
MHDRRQKQRVISKLKRLPARPDALLEKLPFDNERGDSERHCANQQVRPEEGDIDPAGASEKQQPAKHAKAERLQNPENPG